MAKQDFVQRYIKIVELLRTRPRTYEEICERIVQIQYEDNIEPKFSKRTFQRDIAEIKKLWNFEIDYDRKSKQYVLDEEVAEVDFNRIAEAFNITSVLKTSDSFSNYIFLDTRKPKGTEHFSDILHAIQNNLAVTFLHHSYWNGDITKRVCVPKVIKESQNRWYLFGYDIDNKQYKPFGLDRISEFEIIRGKYLVPDIDINDYFQHCFGVAWEEKPEKIILEFDNSQKNYIKSLPFHHSQKVIIENDTHFTIELFMYSTYDFIMELLRYGSSCEVKEPKFFREKMKTEAEELYLRYK